MDKKQQILIRIEKLQQTRDYADEVESVRLTEIIEGLQQEYEQIDSDSERETRTSSGR